MEEKIKSKSKYPTKRARNLEDYMKYLEVWDLRKKEFTWDEIRERLKLNSIQNARDHYNSAEKLIREGFPI